MPAPTRHDRTVERILALLMLILAIPIAGFLWVMWLTLHASEGDKAVGALWLLAPIAYILYKTLQRIWLFLGAGIAGLSKRPPPPDDPAHVVLGKALLDLGYFGPQGNGPDVVVVIHSRLENRWRPSLGLQVKGADIPFSNAQYHAILETIVGSPPCAWRLLGMDGPDACRVPAPHISAHEKLARAAQVQSKPPPSHPPRSWPTLHLDAVWLAMPRCIVHTHRRPS